MWKSLDTTSIWPNLKLYIFIVTFQTHCLIFFKWAYPAAKSKCLILTRLPCFPYSSFHTFSVSLLSSSGIHQSHHLDGCQSMDGCQWTISFRLFVFFEAFIFYSHYTTQLFYCYCNSHLFHAIFSLAFASQINQGHFAKKKATPQTFCNLK